MEWSTVSSPNRGASGLSAVAAVSANNIWAVGHTFGGTGDRTLIEHWNGVAWTIVDSPNPPGADAQLQAIEVVGAADIWAAGYYYDSATTEHTLLEHWDGGSWTIIPSPDGPSGYNQLAGIAAVASNDVWAVAQGQQEVILHWDGFTWSLVPGADNGGLESHLRAITAIAVNDVWAAGYYYDSATGFARPLIQHWDGSQWSVVPSPYVGEDFLNGIAAVGPHDVWAVGVADYTNTLTEHWDGNAWTIVPSQGGGGELFGVAAVTARDVWAVGSGFPLPIIERYYCP
jgi:hypothetical protein